MSSPKTAKKLEKLNNKDKPYSCTGHFQTDFTELCREIDFAVIPPVVLRAIPPCDVKQEKTKKKLKHHVHTHSHSYAKADIHADPSMEPVEPLPKTYTVKDRFEYFKPTIQVQMDNPDKQDTVTEIYIRGWKINSPIMHIFKQCWPAVEMLHTINLWNVGLTGEVVSIFALFLPECGNVKTLILDGNCLKEENWHELIGKDSPVQYLSLRNCSITDKGAEAIGHALGTIESLNNKLTSLNLAGNHIGNRGCEAIAGGLRMNRTLMCLSLLSNQVGDAGCSKLAEVLSPFPLNQEEVVERRRQMSVKLPAPTKKKVESPTRSRSPKQMKRVKSSAKQRKEREDDKKGGSRKEERSSFKKESRLSPKEGQTLKVPKSSKASMSPSSVNTGKSGSKEGKRERRISHDLLDVSTVMTVLKTVNNVNGELWVPGNRILASLNLSRNKITVVGLKALWNVMLCQTSGTPGDEFCGPGLVKLDLQKNDFPPDHELLAEIENKLLHKEPICKSPANQQEETATKSIHHKEKDKKSNGMSKEK